MKTLIQALLFSSISTTAFATSNIIPEETNLLMWGFLGFSACILLIQTLPALIMFISMLKGIFSTSNINVVERN